MKLSRARLWRHGSLLFRLFPQDRRKIWLTRSNPSCAAAIAVVCLSGNATAQNAFDMEVVARTGQTLVDGPATGFGPPSVNNNGEIAFIAQTSATSAIYRFSPTTGQLSRASISGAVNRFAQLLQINDGGMIVGQEIASGTTFIRAWPSDASGVRLIARGCFALSQSDPNWAACDYDIVFTSPTINSAGDIAYAAERRHSMLTPCGATNTTNCIVRHGANLSYFSESVITPNSTSRPQMADDGYVVYKESAQTSGSILLTGGNPASSIGISTGFTDTGRAPGISDDGKFISFTATAGSSSQANIKPGAGVFVAIRSGSAFQWVRIAGLGNNQRLDPGETFDDRNGNGVVDIGEDRSLTRFEDSLPNSIASIDGTQRVAIGGVSCVQLAGSASGQRSFSVVFIATDINGRQNLVSSQVKYASGPCNGSPAALGVPQVFHRVVARSGDAVAGQGTNSLGTFSTLLVGDPIGGASPPWVVFSAITSTGARVVIRARLDRPIVLDPGHGRTCYPVPSSASIACSPWRTQRSRTLQPSSGGNAIVEDDLTVSIGSRIRTELLNRGRSVALLRSNGNALLTRGNCSSGGCGADLLLRRIVAEALGARAFISLHSDAMEVTGHNGSGSARPTGSWTLRFSGGVPQIAQLSVGDVVEVNGLQKSNKEILKVQSIAASDITFEPGAADNAFDTSDSANVRLGKIDTSVSGANAFICNDGGNTPEQAEEVATAGALRLAFSNLGIQSRKTTDDCSRALVLKGSAMPSMLIEMGFHTHIRPDLAVDDEFSLHRATSSSSVDADIREIARVIDEDLPGAN